MQVKVGTDLIKLSNFLKSAKAGGQSFLDKLFTPQEIRQNSLEQLGSIFAVKEALMKALEQPGIWQGISTNRRPDGKVDLSLTDPDRAQKILSLDTSVSHDGGWIIATAVVVFR